jgi:hypothetical protein
MARPNRRVLRATRAKNPNHHLWNNNGTWWVHYTVHLPDYTKQRIRQSLKTKSVRQARLRRDQLIGGPRSTVAAARGCSTIVHTIPIFPNFK